MAHRRLHGRGFALFAAAALASACGSGTSLEEVRAIQDSGLHAEAEAPLRALLERTPEDPELNLRLGVVLDMTGRPGEAVFPLRKATSDAEFGAQAGQRLASLFLEMRNFEEAIREADALLARDPADHAAWFVRGRAAEQVGRFEIALESADAILAAEPGSLDAAALRARSLAALERFDEAEDAYRRVREVGAADPARAGRACLALALFLVEKRKQEDRAIAAVKECLAAHHDDPAAPGPAADVYDALDRKEDGTRIVREALARWPESDELRALLAQRLVAARELEEAETVLLEGAVSAPSPERWLAVADVRRRRDDFEGALYAVEEALAGSPANAEALHFSAADLLFELGRVDEAEERMGEIRDPALRLVLEGRLVLERGDPKRALEILTRAVEQWPGNAGARIQAARAAHQLGDLERAQSELREASRAAPEDSDAALLLARFALLQGDTEAALGYLSRHHEHRGFTTPEAYRVAARALLAAHRPKDARTLLEGLARQEGQAGLGVGELAELAAKQEGPAAAVRVVEKSGLDLGAPENEPALRAWVRAQLALGQGAAAAAKLDALQAAHPESAPLPAVRGQVLLAAGDLDAAQQAFDAALAIDPDTAAALAGAGWVALQRGDAAAGRELLERAAARAPGEPDYAYAAARARLAAGDEAGAELALQGVLRAYPEHAGAANDLAFRLARRGESLDLALQLAERAARLAPSPEVLDTVGFVQWRRGDAAAARRSFEAALAERPDYATARYHLALVQRDAGEEAASLESLERALAGGAFPEAEEARRLLAQLRQAAGG